MNRSQVLLELEVKNLKINKSKQDKIRKDLEWQCEETKFVRNLYFSKSKEFDNKEESLKLLYKKLKCKLDQEKEKLDLEFENLHKERENLKKFAKKAKNRYEDFKREVELLMNTNSSNESSRIEDDDLNSSVIESAECSDNKIPKKQVHFLNKIEQKPQSARIYLPDKSNFKENERTLLPSKSTVIPDEAKIRLLEDEIVKLRLKLSLNPNTESIQMQIFKVQTQLSNLKSKKAISTSLSRSSSIENLLTNIEKHFEQREQRSSSRNKNSPRSPVDSSLLTRSSCVSPESISHILKTKRPPMPFIIPMLNLKEKNPPEVSDLTKMQETRLKEKEQDLNEREARLKKN